MMRSRAWQIALIILAGIPAFLFVCLGHFGRLVVDDFCIFHIARSMDAWQAIVYHNNTNTASFSRLLLHSLFAPFDAMAMAVTSLAAVVISTAGLYLILRRAVLSILLYRPHGTALWIIAVLATAVSINAFATPESFYWYNASSGYVLPAAVCILYFALLFEIACKERSTQAMRLAAPISAAIAFALGGASEMFVVFQFALLALAILFSAALLTSSIRLRFMSLFIAGWLGTVAALIIHLLSPGTRHRIEDIEAGPWLPLRSAPALLEKSLEPILTNLADPEAFAGFILLFGLGLSLTLILYRPTAALAPVKARQVECWPLQLCLLLQLLFVPVLWSHVSDLRQVAGRFSYGFAIVVAVNLLSIAAMAVLFLWRRRIGRALAAKHNGLMAYTTCVLIYVLTLFAMTQVRSIHFKAATYLYLSSLTILCAMVWQLSLCLADQRAKRIARSATLFFIVPVATTAALVLVSLYGQGVVTARMLAPIAYLQVIPGLIWGVFFAYVIQRLRLTSATSQRWKAVHVAIGLVLAASVAAGIVHSHAKLIPDFSTFARAWDARHEQLVRARDDGLEEVEILPLEYDLTHILGEKDWWYGIEKRCVQLYYDINSIRLVPS